MVFRAKRRLRRWLGALFGRSGGDKRSSRSTIGIVERSGSVLSRWGLSFRLYTVYRLSSSPSTLVFHLHLLSTSPPQTSSSMSSYVSTVHIRSCNPFHQPTVIYTISYSSISINICVQFIYLSISSSALATLTWRQSADDNYVYVLFLFPLSSTNSYKLSTTDPHVCRCPRSPAV